MIVEQMNGLMLKIGQRHFHTTLTLPKNQGLHLVWQYFFFSAPARRLGFFQLFSFLTVYEALSALI